MIFRCYFSISDELEVVFIKRLARKSNVTANGPSPDLDTSNSAEASAAPDDVVGAGLPWERDAHAAPVVVKKSKAPVAFAPVIVVESEFTIFRTQGQIMCYVTISSLGLEFRNQGEWLKNLARNFVQIVSDGNRKRRTNSNS